MLSCNICKNKENNTSYLGREMKLGLRDEFTYFKCSNCGCLQIAEIPENLEKYYENYYSLDDLKQDPTIVAYLRKQLFDFKMNNRNVIGKMISKSEEKSFYWIEPGMFNFNSSILDVGCGKGRLLFKMGNSGFRNLRGTDPYTDNITYKTKYGNIPIEKKEIYEINGEFDFIMLHHTLEHMPNQHDVFDKLISLMHKNSKLLINIPIIDSYAWEQYEMNAFQLGDIPRHLFLHSFKSIDNLASQHGLKIEKTGHYGDMQIFRDSEKLKRDIVLTEKIEFTEKENSFFEKKLNEIKNTAQAGVAYFYMSLKN